MNKCLINRFAIQICKFKYSDIVLFTVPNIQLYVMRNRRYGINTYYSRKDGKDGPILCGMKNIITIWKNLKE